MGKGGSCYGHLVGNSQGCYQTSYNAQDGFPFPPTKSYLSPNVNNAEVEKHYSELTFLRQKSKNKRPVNDSINGLSA